MRVLVVDHSRAMRTTLRGLLEGLGYAQVEEACDGDEALSRLSTFQPELILIDWNLPGMDGLTFLKTIRRQGNSTLVIMVTTEAERARVTEAIRAGVNHYVIRPFTREALSSRIQETLERASLGLGARRAAEPAEGEPKDPEYRLQVEPGLGQRSIAGEEPARESDRVDHYSRVGYVRVEAGMKVATLVPADDPTPDAHRRAGGGEAIGSGLCVDGNGNVLAAISGVLVQDRTGIRVSPLLEVDGSVDFSVGNVDFDGTVIVRGGVCPRFEVKATGDVVVDGLIEGARIECGGNFRCRQGIVGQDRGSLIVGGDAHVKYLNVVTGRVRGALFVDKEILGCRLLVDGNLTCHSGSIIGGEVTIASHVRVARLGSDAEATTTVILGEVALLEAALKKLKDEQRALEHQAADLQAQERILRLGSGRRLTEAKKEDLVLIEFGLAETSARIDAGAAERQRLEQALERARMVHVEVTGAIYPKVRIQVRDQLYQFEQIINGPLTIAWNAARKVELVRENRPTRRLADVARPLKDAA